MKNKVEGKFKEQARERHLDAEMNLEYATLATMHGATVNSYEQVHRTACRSLFMSFIHLNGEVATRQEIDDQEACAGQHQHCPWNTFPRLLKVVLSFP